MLGEELSQFTELGVVVYLLQVGLGQSRRIPQGPPGSGRTMNDLVGRGERLLGHQHAVLPLAFGLERKA